MLYVADNICSGDDEYIFLSEELKIDQNRLVVVNSTTLSDCTSYLLLAPYYDSFRGMIAVEFL